MKTKEQVDFIVESEILAIAREGIVPELCKSSGCCQEKNIKLFDRILRDAKEQDFNK